MQDAESAQLELQRRTPVLASALEQPYQAGQKARFAGETILTP
jgi:hypothetical protein